MNIIVRYLFFLKIPCSPCFLRVLRESWIFLLRGLLREVKPFQINSSLIVIIIWLLTTYSVRSNVSQISYTILRLKHSFCPLAGTSTQRARGRHERACAHAQAVFAADNCTGRKLSGVQNQVWVLTAQLLGKASWKNRTRLLRKSGI